MKIFSRAVTLVLLACLFLASCGGIAPFDFKKDDLSPYVSFGDADYRDISISVERPAEVTDAKVKEEFESYFSNASFFYPVEDDTRAIANGDTIYLNYVGILVSKLETALSDGKIPDITCSGLSYDEIAELKLGFEGGSTARLTKLVIGSNSYISGFESGLVGYVPAEHGKDAPIPLRLTFPATYGNEELAGKEVIFFCALGYIGDTAKKITTENATGELINEILGLTGENAYEDVEACLDKIREGMETDNENTLRKAEVNAVWTALVDMAELTVTDPIASAYINIVLDEYLGEMKYIYDTDLAYYSYIFGTTAAPTRDTVINYLGYTADNYFAQMKTAADTAIRREMVFWYVVRQENYSLSDGRFAELKEEYKEKYGAEVFAGYTDDGIYDILLQETYFHEFVDRLKEEGRVTYTEADAS